MIGSYNKEGIEGEIISGEKLKTYENTLKFEETLLKGKTVLNFGSGGSNLTQEIKNHGIECNMVELDIKNDPSSEASIGYYAKPAIKLVDTLLGDDEFHQNLVGLQRRLSGTEGRTFVQGDGRELPFGNDTFDVTFALKSVYQVPAEERPSVYAELLRVNKVVHIAPVMTSDFEILSELASSMNFEIILCGPIDVKFDQAPGFPISSYADYDLFRDEVPYEQRVEIPPSDDVSIVSILGKPVHAWFSGGVMILKKRR